MHCNQFQTAEVKLCSATGINLRLLLTNRTEPRMIIPAQKKKELLSWLNLDEVRNTQTQMSKWFQIQKYPSTLSSGKEKRSKLILCDGPSKIIDLQHWNFVTLDGFRSLSLSFN